MTLLKKPNFESKMFLISYVISVCYIKWSLAMGSNQSHQKMCLPITVEDQCEEATPVYDPLNDLSHGHHQNLDGYIFLRFWSGCQY